GGHGTLTAVSEPLYVPRMRPERLIAAGRVLLAVASLFAVWLDPAEPIRYATVAYSVLVAYVVYAAAVAVLLWGVEAVPRWWPVVTHAVDLACFSLFIFFTDPASPFTVYFVFALLAATLRWQVRGTLWTATIVMAVFFGFGIYFGIILHDPEFDLRGFIIRSVYLFVLAGLFAYVGTQDRRTVREMSLLATWPETVRDDTESLVRDLLSYAAPLLAAPRLVLAWSEIDTPWRRLAVWDRGAWTHDRQSREIALVNGEISDRAFICRRGPNARTLVQEPDGLRLALWAGDPIAAGFADRFATVSVVSVPMQGESFSGRLFVLDKAEPTLDNLVLTEIVAGVIAARLDAFGLTAQLRQASATEERIRLARDLHDGVLQSFTGIALRLAAIRRMMNGEAPAVISAIEDAQQMLASEQRDLRFFIQELKPAASAPESTPLEARLDELAQRMEREWDLRVELRLGDQSDGLSVSLCRDVYHIIREALVNAARHGSASQAHVTIQPVGAAAIAVSITDNGRGFPFTGRFTDEQLATLNLGPKNLRDRVRALQGSLVLESGPAGAELNVTLPLGVAA
ncbi:MAG: histidine kinase, partial [Acidobacteriota bacterium]|nr:histidine kinase [Acidobacteriota bacterium]